MENSELARRFATLTTPHIADGCMRSGVPVRCAPAGTRVTHPGARLAGGVLPARHVGSVDVFLEAFERARQGDVLVVDNGGRLDESCVGDLAALEARAAGVAGMLIWGLHRDTVDIGEIGLPVFSLGSLPAGPLTAGERPADVLDATRVGEWTVTAEDVVFGDEDGAIFVPREAVGAVLDAAESIRDVERAQAQRIRSGLTLREQVGFADYLARRTTNPALTFREHLRTVGGAIEE
jgi:regulator of RNase E activity RraA